MMGSEIERQIFQNNISFRDKALQVFSYQYEMVDIYGEFCRHLGKHPGNVRNLEDIPFLPIEFFKYHKILSKERGFETIFRSSGTTGQQQSQHFVADLQLYEKAIHNGFTTAYDAPEKYCILGLLPSYLERQDASLVHMVNYLMTESGHRKNGFYLDNLAALAKQIHQLQANNQPVILFGVTFALLDFAEQFPMNLQDVIVIETGGMKGRRKEMTRSELHFKLTTAFQVKMIHSEYGMTELLSQAYFNTEGTFTPASTMKVLTREINDPFAYPKFGQTGALNIIDLANIYSCSFIATQDIGRVYKNGNFDVLGRMDFSDLRGCNLMVI